MKMSYWSKTVVPGFKKMFDKSGKKALAAEACKTFADSKEGITKELEEKKPELEAKVAKLYEDSPPEIKALLKEPKVSGLKKHAEKVQKFLEGLVEIDFPGAKPVCEAAKVTGPGLVSGPITFVFEKVSTFVVVAEEKKEEVAVEATTAAVAVTEEEASTGTKDKEIVVEGETKPEEEITPVAAPVVEEAITAEKKVETPAPVVEEVITTEKKVESAPELPVAKPVPVAEPVVTAAAEPAAASAAKVETPTVVAAPAAAAAAKVETPTPVAAAAAAPAPKA